MWDNLLNALSKTDNGWFQFMRGNLTIDFKKFVDINELYLQITCDKDRAKSAIHYLYEFSEFTKLKTKNLSPDSCER